MATNPTGPFRDGWSGRCKGCGEETIRSDDKLCHDCWKDRMEGLLK